MRRVSFNNSVGTKVSFNQDGELEARFDVINWVPFPNQSFLRVRVGRIDPKASQEEMFTICEEAIVWPRRFNQVGSTTYISTVHCFAVLKSNPWFLGFLDLFRISY